MTTKKDPVTLCITSGKGGVGKTSLAVNLAFALANKGLRVLVVDGDLGLANVDVLLGLSVKRTIRDVLDSGADPSETVVHLERNLGVLPASSGVPEMVTLGPEEQTRLGNVLTSIASHFDYALMDTAAGIGPAHGAKDNRSPQWPNRTQRTGRGLQYHQSLFPNKRVSPEAMIKNGDKYLYQKKREVSNRVIGGQLVALQTQRQ